MSTDVVIGIDVGTSGVKIAAVAGDGRILAEGSDAFEPTSPQPGWAEESPEQWWHATARAAQACRSSAATELHVVAIGVSGHMSALVLADQQGQPLRPSMLLADSRGDEQARAMNAAVRNRIIERTGNAPGSAFTLPKLLWVREREPDVFSQARWVLFPKDFVRYRITGHIGTERTDAGNLLLYDPARDTWDTGLCEELGVDPALLPPLCDSAAVIGTVGDAAAKACGFAAGTPVVAGGADMACAAIGAGAIREGTAAITVGTASPVIATLSATHPSGVGKVTFHPHANPGSLYAMGTVFAGGLGMRWLAKAFGEEQAANADPAAYFDALSESAAEAPAGAGGLLFLPFLMGSSTPFWNSADRAAWVGMTYTTNRSHLVRAVMEGVAFNCRDSIAVFRDMGIAIDHVHLAGGGARSGLWRRIMADAFGIPVRPVRNHNVSAFGAAILAGTGVGFFSSLAGAAERLPWYDETVTPLAETRTVYDRHYHAYRDARDALVAVNKQLGGGADE